MIFVGEIDPDLQEMFGRDDSQRVNWSWFVGKISQGWFPTREFILIHRKCLGGMISSRKIDPDSQEISGRDDFCRGDWSWFDEKLLQGWFPSGRLILICRRCLAGMIFVGEIDPDLQEMFGRDDSQRGDWSWFVGKISQGWFPTWEFILIRGKCLAGMHFRLWRAFLP